ARHPARAASANSRCRAVSPATPALASPRTGPNARPRGPPRTPVHRGRAAHRASGRAAPSRHMVIRLKQRDQAKMAGRATDGAWLVDIIGILIKMAGRGYLAVC